MVGVAAGAADRIGDAVTGLAQGGAAAVGDVIATVLRRKRPRRAPHGTTAARATANRVRARGEDATQKVVEEVRKAKRAARPSKSSRRSKKSPAAELQKYEYPMERLRPCQR